MSKPSKQDVFVKYYAPGGNKVRKIYSWLEGKSQGHKIIDIGVIGKGIIGGVCISNMKYLFLTVQKLFSEG